jgi:hypothetical protein
MLVSGFIFSSRGAIQTLRRYNIPAKDLHHHGLDVWETRTIFKARKTITTNNSVDFSTRFSLDAGVK